MIQLADQTVQIKTDSRSVVDVATELTKAMIENGLLHTVNDVQVAYQELFNAAYYARSKAEKPSK